MSFDFSTLITDRKLSDADYARALIGRITNGTATAEELAEWNAATLKGAYDYTDLNRVTEAMDEINSMLSAEGYQTGYQPVEVHPGDSLDLPEGYTKLESIESTGTQYIKIPYYPNQNTRVVFDYLPKSTNNTILFGSRTSTSSSDLFLILHASDTNSLRTDFGGSKVTTGMNPDIRTVIDKDQNKTKILGQSFYSGAATFTCKYPMGIFCGNTGGSYTQLSSYVLYSCKIYDDGSLSYDLKPCKNPHGEVGLYDLVTGSFYGNAGTGTFYAGPIIDTEEPTDEEEENNPYTWYESDSPTLPQLTQYLVNVRALRSAIANQSPEVPGVKDMFSVEAANNIEKILLSIEHAIQIMKQTYVPCGATACGGDYL